ncbi:MAG TPA: D-amino acid dehydrogenase [Parvibaculum sp.]|uniref:D-amino acid dehydrogenase n=1 Tax=Parvibaculum sp. TaxID=2024848 RepID=UPI002B7CCB70|nr:D-amino acid dehydrogenase [Parvibaculum sp.]HMM15394.1 D-amino acid dehydrogenase [Parvibaculum sp.]
MRVLVIGAGIVGVTTAYEFAERGHEVTLLERREGAGLETSYANGAQLGAGEVTPWPGPEVPLLALRWMGRPDGPFRLRLKPDPEQWIWLWRFLLRCRNSAREERVLPNLQLALYTRARMDAVAEKFEAQGTPILFDEERAGILQIFHYDRSFKEAIEGADVMRRAGLDQRVLSARECVDVEPALGPAYQRGGIKGALYCETDRTGDAYLYTKALAEGVTRMGVRFVTGVEVERFEVRGDKVAGVRTKDTLYEGDIVVLAAGVGSAALARQTGVRIPVYPLKGYSVTLPVGSGVAPHASVTDEARKIVVSRLGNRVRIAGTAEVCGYDTKIEMARARSVLDGALDFMPQLSDVADKAEYWTGLRPMSPDGSPIIGQAGRYSNVYLNTGHGSLGWTLASGSAAALADTICGSTPQIDLTPFSIKRFAFV